MKWYGWTNWILLAVIIFLIGGNSMIFLYPLWQLNRIKAEKAKSVNQASCLKASDFYSVHLTTYFLAGNGDGAADPKRENQAV